MPLFSCLKNHLQSSMENGKSLKQVRGADWSPLSSKVDGDEVYTRKYTKRAVNTIESIPHKGRQQDKMQSARGE